MDRDAHPIRNIGLAGAGLVGIGWAIVFARMGLTVSLFDINDDIRSKAPDRIARSLDAMARHGLLSEESAVVGRRIHIVSSLEAAVSDADYVQESVLEEVELKTSVSQEIERWLQPHAIVGSSTSGIPASKFTYKLHRRADFVVVHPVNPPHLIPAVEIVPSPWTSTQTIGKAQRLMDMAGQKTVHVNGQIDGFILNRLQGALLNEAMMLLGEGYGTAADIDSTVRDGLALRWSFMGPLETIDLNAVGGIDDYARRLGPLYTGMLRDPGTTRPWSAETVAEATAQRRQNLPHEALEARRAWRDERLMEFLAFRKRSANASAMPAPHEPQMVNADKGD